MYNIYVAFVSYRIISALMYSTWKKSNLSNVQGENKHTHTHTHTHTHIQIDRQKQSYFAKHFPGVILVFLVRCFLYLFLTPVVQHGR